MGEIIRAAPLRISAQPLNGSREGYRVVELIEACHRSAKAGGEIIAF